ncbi:MAG TPA: alpha/beta hydrolase, partial [Casimicrobiaceae bacterium]|nr:alpha/beta hydrolase [Casimicrobiaceae bacterium]
EQIRFTLYNAMTASATPYVIHRAAQGDFDPFARLAMQWEPAFRKILAWGMHLSVTCAEDVPRVGLALREQTLAGKRSARLARLTLAICDEWPRGHAPIEAYAPVSSDVPALILSGGLDPVTPPGNGAQVARSLSRHRHVVAPGYGHIVSPHACAPRLIAAFVADAGFASLPEDCLRQLETSTPPALWTGPLGPATP